MKAKLTRRGAGQLQVGLFPDGKARFAGNDRGDPGQFARRSIRTHRRRACAQAARKASRARRDAPCAWQRRRRIAATPFRRSLHDTSTRISCAGSRPRCRALAAHERALARAMELGDIDLPPGAPNAQDRAQLQAAAPLYFASELEAAGLLPHGRAGRRPVRQRRDNAAAGPDRAVACTRSGAAVVNVWTPRSATPSSRA